MTGAAGERMPWRDVPAELRSAVEQVLGSRIVSAQSQTGGFSPGSADRVQTADGRRAFVKTAWSRVNARSAEIHRREADVVSALPSSAHAPRLLGSVECGDWVAVVLEDVEGIPPATPWRQGQLAAVLEALGAITAAELAESTPVPRLEDEMVGLFGGWGRIEDPAALALDTRLATWVEGRHPDMVAASTKALEDVRGTRLVHQDVRADNILIRPDGAVVLVDWPWASRGVGWFDALALLINVRLFDPGYDVEAVMRTHRVFGEMRADAATRVLVALAGFFLEASTQPEVPGIPTLRAFQRAQGIATLRWLSERGLGVGLTG